MLLCAYNGSEKWRFRGEKFQGMRKEESGDGSSDWPSAGYRIRLVPRDAGVTEFEKMEYNRLRFDGQRGNLVFSMSGSDKVEKVMCADTAIPPNYSQDCILHRYYFY